jgi:hypothetical protein
MSTVSSHSLITTLEDKRMDKWVSKEAIVKAANLSEKVHKDSDIALRKGS